MDLGSSVFDYTTRLFVHISAFLHIPVNIIGLFFLAVAIISLLNVFAGASAIDPGIEVVEHSFLSNSFRFVSLPVAIVLVMVCSIFSYRAFTLPQLTGEKIYTSPHLMYQINIPSDWHIREGDPPILFNRGFEPTTFDNATFYSSDQQCNIVIGDSDDETVAPDDFQRDRAWRGPAEIELYEERNPRHIFIQRSFALAPASDIAVYAECDLSLFRYLLSTISIHR
jgi:hypothetical protein